jgi:hypothetical protein
MSSKAIVQEEKAKSLAQLREWIKPGDTVFTVLRHVSRSGMQREIGLVTFLGDDPIHPNHHAATVLGLRMGTQDRDAVKVGGCGMDMGFHLVYELSHALFPAGFECTGKGCQSNDHSNGDRDYLPHHHKDGGYAIRHRWL